VALYSVFAAAVVFGRRRRQWWQEAHSVPSPRSSLANILVFVGGLRTLIALLLSAF